MATQPSTALASVTSAVAKRFGVEGTSGELVDILKQTAFKQRGGGVVSDAQMTALMMVAKQYNLNPFLKEIYAFAGKDGGISPIVGVDGWSNIINSHPQFDGMEFRYSENSMEVGGHKTHEWIECLMYRKDRTRPTIIREYFTEVFGGGGDRKTPWDTHPTRFHRHKAMIQTARMAFGFGGISEADEVPGALDVIDGQTGEIQPAAQAAMPVRRSAATPAATEEPRNEPIDVPARVVESDRPRASPRTQAQPNDTDGPINAGQVRYLQQKMTSYGVADEALPAMLARLGIAAVDVTMLKSQFTALLAELESVS